MSDNKKKLKMVTLFPKCSNNILTKDVGMIPYIMYKYYGYDSTVVSYDKRGPFPYLNKEVKGLKIEYIKNTVNICEDGCAYLIKNSKDIDVLHVYHLKEYTFNWIKLYKSINPKGKVFLKLDAGKVNKVSYNQLFNKEKRAILDKCDLISVETKDIYEYLNKNWPIKVEYIPNGFYTEDYGDKPKVKYEDKENIICFVGRVESGVKCTNILMEAFAKASEHIKGWKLKIIGKIVEKDFHKYIEEYFEKNPNLKDKVIFTGHITDRKKLGEEYKKSKIFCLTSKSESFGIVLAEAISQGCYVISSNVGAANDITKNRKYGMIFEKYNVKQLTECLIKACNNESELKKICNEVQNYAYDEFNWVKICAKIDDILRSE